MIQIKENRYESGFIRLILVIIVVVILLAYFNVNLRELLSSDATRDNLAVLKEIGEKVWSFILIIWADYIRESALWVWQNIIIERVWPLISDWLKTQKNT